MVQSNSPAFVGADIGGTFTDMVWLDAAGNVYAKKTLSTPDDYSAGILAGFDGLVELSGRPAAGVRRLVHGTTVATNAIIERNGARVALVTTLGFRDVLEIGRIRTPRLYDIMWRKPEPLVPRELRFEVNERITPQGEVIVPLQDQELETVVGMLKRVAPEAIAVCLINAYANGLHERMIGRRLAQAFPGLPISLSSEVLPEIREYERTSTTVVNSYLRPLIEHYLQHLSVGIRDKGVEGSIWVMQSNGGAMALDTASEFPIFTVESGPAGGVIACAALAERLGVKNAITLDMGGTTAKASLIEDGKVNYTQEIELRPGISVPSRLIKGGGYVIRTPAIDISEVGTGGGSIAWLDAANALQVGPESAGAVPGPACYMRGGTKPTVTDANVVLGLIDPHYLVGKEMLISREAAVRAVRDQIAMPLGLDVERAAHAIHVIANARMIRAVKHVTTERGRDPRELALVAFGGSGPVHGALMAQAMGIRRVIVPPLPGLFSALGLLFARLTRHYIQTYLEPLERLDIPRLRAGIARLHEQAVVDLGRDGYSPDQLNITASVGLRYTGQRSELTLPLVDEGDIGGGVRRLTARFHAEHERLYGHKDEAQPVEIANIRLQAVVLADDLNLIGTWSGISARDSTGEGRPPRQVYFGPEVGWLETPVVPRSDLRGARHAGPMIIEDYGSTTVAPRDSFIWLDEMGDIVIELNARPSST